MTADARPPSAILPTNQADDIAALGSRPRLFPSRLGLAPHDAWPGDGPGGDAGRIWLLSRLWLRHAALEHRIAEEAARPRPDPEALRALKREKLSIRDRIALLERRS